MWFNDKEVTSCVFIQLSVNLSGIRETTEENFGIEPKTSKSFMNTRECSDLALCRAELILQVDCNQTLKVILSLSLTARPSLHKIGASRICTYVSLTGGDF